MLDIVFSYLLLTMERDDLTDRNESCQYWLLTKISELCPRYMNIYPVLDKLGKGEKIALHVSGQVPRLL